MCDGVQEKEERRRKMGKKKGEGRRKELKEEGNLRGREREKEDVESERKRG